VPVWKAKKEKLGLAVGLLRTRRCRQVIVADMEGKACAHNVVSNQTNTNSSFGAAGPEEGGGEWGPGKVPGMQFFL